jgi:hypothetical protein
MSPIRYALLGGLVLMPGCFCAAPPADYEDFATELGAMREMYPEGKSCNVAIAGECNDGDVLFLHEFFIDSGITRFFDTDTGAFIGYETQEGFWALFCGGRRFHPRPISCRNGVVTEVVCGDGYEVGDAYP